MAPSAGHLSPSATLKPRHAARTPRHIFSRFTVRVLHVSSCPSLQLGFQTCCSLQPRNGERKTKRNESGYVSGRFGHGSPGGREARGRGHGPKQALGRHRSCEECWALSRCYIHRQTHLKSIVLRLQGSEKQDNFVYLSLCMYV